MFITANPAPESKGLFTRRLIFLNPPIIENALEKKKGLHKTVFKDFAVYTETLETTENDVVPMPGLV